MPAAVLETLNLQSISPQEAKFLTEAYDAIFSQGLEEFQGKNSLGSPISINKYGISSFITKLAVENHLEPDQLIERLRELAAIAAVENTTISVDQPTLNSLIAANEQHLEELKKIDERSVVQVQSRLQKIGQLAKTSRTVYSTNQPEGPTPAVVPQTPDITEAVRQLGTIPTGTPEHSAALRHLEALVARSLPAEAAANAPAVAVDLIKRAAQPTPPTETAEVAPKPVPAETITTEAVNNSLQETLGQLPLNDQQRKTLDSLLQTHDTVSHLVTQIHHPDVLVPGQTVTEDQVNRLHDQVYSQLEHDFEGKLSPLATTVITATIVGQVLPVAKIATELELAQKSGAVLLTSESLPSLAPEIIKIQNQVEWIYKTIPDRKEAEAIISAAVASLQIPEDKKSLINLKDLEIQLQQGLTPETIRAVQAGLTSEGLTDALQKEILSPKFAHTRDKVRNAQEGAAAAGAAAAKPSFQRLSPVKAVRLQNGRPNLSLATASDRPSSLWLSFKSRVSQLNKDQEVSPRQITSVPQSPNQSPFALFSVQGFRQTSDRLAGAHRLLTTSQGRFALQLQQSLLGRFYNRVYNLFHEQVVNRFTSWAGKQAVVVAAKNAFGLIGKQAVVATAKTLAVKTAAKAALKKLVTKAATSVLTRLGVEAVAGATVAPGVGWVMLLLDLGWQLVKNVLFNPKAWKKILDWLQDRPWVLAAMLASPLLLGGPGFLLAGIGALGLLGIAATGGTIALAGMGTALGAGFIGLMGMVFAPIIVPILVVVTVFLGSWLLLTIFYLLFILPQGFMTNQTARQISLIVTESPVYLSLSKSASPRTITNEQITQIATNPQTITYTVSFVPDKNTSLQDIKAREEIDLIKVDDNGKINRVQLRVPDNWQAKIPSSVSTGSPTSDSYTLTLDKQFLDQNSLTPGQLTDSLITNTLTLQFSAQNNSDTIQGLTRTAQAAVLIGHPKVTSPNGWPIWGPSDCVTQGPNAPFSHRGIQAIDISSPVGQPVYATHSGTVSWWWDPADGYSVLVTSPDKLYSTLYAHLDRRAPVGPIDYHGIVGYTTANMNNGFMTGPHLHYQLRGSPINGPDISKYLDSPPPLPVPPAVIYNCTYSGKDYHVRQP